MRPKTKRMFYVGVMTQEPGQCAGRGGRGARRRTRNPWPPAFVMDSVRPRLTRRILPIANHRRRPDLRPGSSRTLDRIVWFATNFFGGGSGNLIDKDREKIQQVRSRSTLVETRFQIFKELPRLGIVLILLLLPTSSSRSTSTTGQDVTRKKSDLRRGEMRKPMDRRRDMMKGFPSNMLPTPTDQIPSSSETPTSDTRSLRRRRPTYRHGTSLAQEHIRRWWFGAKSTWVLLIAFRLLAALRLTALLCFCWRNCWSPPSHIDKNAEVRDTTTQTNFGGLREP